MTALTQTGDICPNPDCSEHGRCGSSSIIRFGRTSQNRQRFRCKACGMTFSEHYGTISYRKQYSEPEILQTLALMAKGLRITSLSRVRGIKEDTILAWLREAVLHAETVEERLMQEYEVPPAQIDALWRYVGYYGSDNGR